MNKKVLLTGGNGYIARNLKPLLESNGYVVYAPSHTELDILNKEYLSEYLKKECFDAIIHTATKGGIRTKKDTFEDVYIPNILMYENLESLIGNTPMTVIGSGAEFDRRFPIKEVGECDVLYKFPIDPYGLSKNIITRKILLKNNCQKINILRLFGCFSYDEPNTRFIKSVISNFKQEIPPEIHKDLKMDFFYLDDVFNVLHYGLNGGYLPENLNLVYEYKTNLLGITRIIDKYMGSKSKLTSVKVNSLYLGNDYTGDGYKLSTLPIKLIGLEEGIKRTINKLI